MAQSQLTWKRAAYGAMVATVAMTSGSGLKILPMTWREAKMATAANDMKATLDTMHMYPLRRA